MGVNVDSAGHGMDVLEAVFAEDGSAVEGAGAVVAVDDDGAGFPLGNFGVDAGVEFVKGDEGGAGEFGAGVFIGSATVEEEEITLVVEGFLDVGGMNFPGGIDVELDAVVGVDGLGGIGGGESAEFLIVDELGDGGVVSAGGAIFVAAETEGTELHVEGVEDLEAAEERRTDAGDDFDGFVSLNGADDAAHGAHDAAFGAAWDHSGGRRFGVLAAVAAGLDGLASEFAQVRGEDGVEAFEAEDRAIDVDFFEENAGVVDEVAGGEIVGAVDDDVVGGDPLHGVFGGDAALVFDDFGVGVEGNELLLGGVEFGLSDVVGGVEDLALEVGVVDGVELDEAEGSDAGGGEVEGDGAAEAAGADDEDFGVEEFELPFEADFRVGEVAGVAILLLFSEGGYGVGRHLGLLRMRVGYYSGMDIVCAEIAEDAGWVMGRHAVREYPAECCGVLVGKVAEGKVGVVRAVEARNVGEAGRMADRYVVEPLTIVRAERAAREEELEVVGFYHSHPDCAARASAVDAAEAWEGYMYVIVSVGKEGVREVRGWVKAGEGMREITV